MRDAQHCWRGKIEIEEEEEEEEKEEEEEEKNLRRSQQMAFNAVR